MPGSSQSWRHKNNEKIRKRKRLSKKHLRGVYIIMFKLQKNFAILTTASKKARRFLIVTPIAFSTVAETSPSFNESLSTSNISTSYGVSTTQKGFKTNTRKKKNAKLGEKIPPISSWVYIPKVPRYSSLNDILCGIQVALDEEKQNGILDLDLLTESIKQQQQQQNLNSFENQAGNNESGNSFVSPNVYWDYNMFDPPLPPHMVLEARSFLNKYTLKHSGWYLRFPNKSVVHALLEHQHHTRPIHCSWQQVDMFEYILPSEDFSVNYQRNPLYKAERYQLDDSVIRVEHVPKYMNIDNVLQIFENICPNSNNNEEDEFYEDTKPFSNRSYPLKVRGPRAPIELLIRGNRRAEPNDWNKGVSTSTPKEEIEPLMKVPSHYKISTDTYLVRFQSPSVARSAVRNLQHFCIDPNAPGGPWRIFLQQYPEQIILPFS